MEREVKIVITGCIIAAVSTGIFLSEMDFFYWYDCEEIKQYMMNNLDAPITHDELTESQHMQLHKLLDARC